MGEVVKIYPPGSAERPDAVLEQAIGQYDSVLLIGYNHEGGLNIRSSTNLKCRDILWLIESFKAKMLNGDYFEEGTEEL